MDESLAVLRAVLDHRERVDEIAVDGVERPCVVVRRRADRRQVYRLRRSKPATDRESRIVNSLQEFQGTREKKFTRRTHNLLPNQRKVMGEKSQKNGSEFRFLLRSNQPATAIRESRECEERG